jgi:TPR repeat protein
MHCALERPPAPAAAMDRVRHVCTSVRAGRGGGSSPAAAAPERVGHPASQWVAGAARCEAEALFLLGWCYDTGEGVPRSSERAAELWKQAAAKGHANAQYNLGVLYRDGQGVPQSYERAAELYTQAAAKGNANAQVGLGALYHNGLGVPQSYERAAELWKQAAAKGDANAQYNLGGLYYNGLGVPQSYERAAELYTQAAAKGDADAQTCLGGCYYHGDGVPQSYERAAELYKQAAAKGHALAQYNLGVVYRDGQGVPQSYERAAELYTQAAANGAPYNNSGSHAYSCAEPGPGGLVSLRGHQRHDVVRDGLADMLRACPPATGRRQIYVEPVLNQHGYKPTAATATVAYFKTDARADIIVGTAAEEMAGLPRVVIDVVISTAVQQAERKKRVLYAKWDIPEGTFLPFAMSPYGGMASTAQTFVRDTIRAHVGQSEGAAETARYGKLVRDVRERLAVRLMTKVGYSLVRMQMVANSCVRVEAQLPMGEGAGMYLAPLHGGTQPPVAATNEEEAEGEEPWTGLRPDGMCTTGQQLLRGHAHEIITHAST